MVVLISSVVMRTKHTCFPLSIWSVETWFQVKLVGTLDKMSRSETEVPDVDVIIQDGASIVNMLTPRFCIIFEDFSKQMFFPYIDNKLYYVSSRQSKDNISRQTSLFEVI